MPALARGGPILRVLARELLESCRLRIEHARDVLRQRQPFVAASRGLYAYPSLVRLGGVEPLIDVTQQRNRLGISDDALQVALTGGYENDQIQLLDVATGATRVLTATGATGTYTPTFSADGSELYVGGGYGDGHVYVFSTLTGAELRRLKPSNWYIYTIDRVPGFDLLMIGGVEALLQLISARDGSVLWSSPIALINRAVFSPDGRNVYVGTGSNGVPSETSPALIVYDVN